ncbi:phage baseplate assembly protein V [Paenibacillus sp. UASWS1643]|uniref:phage baseplate assembly protein V n=1 Tax=Paenibacillus sp. UASWS1643 TaxID=2580422 RepID=UPI0012397236|nr:phage baseplate assembly protein V [Paenibacillus sp. UASWS1643]KAA8750090.1 phage baseplate assembly protein V [Paenibacillus sp. UASWS1643]
MGMKPEDMIRVGECDYSDQENNMVTVTFADREDAVSELMECVRPGGFGVTNNFPQVGDTVVCLFLPNGKSTGVCLGVLPDDDLPGEEGQQGTYFEDGSYVYYDQEAGKLMVKAMGGAELESPESVLVKAKSVTAEAENVILKATTVALEGTTSIKGNVSIDGNLSVTGTVSGTNI